MNRILRVAVFLSALAVTAAPTMQYSAFAEGEGQEESGISEGTSNEETNKESETPDTSVGSEEGNIEEGSESSEGGQEQPGDSDGEGSAGEGEDGGSDSVTKADAQALADIESYRLAIRNQNVTVFNNPDHSPKIDAYSAMFDAAVNSTRAQEIMQQLNVNQGPEGFEAFPVLAIHERYQQLNGLNGSAFDQSYLAAVIAALDLAISNIDSHHASHPQVIQWEQTLRGIYADLKIKAQELQQEL